MDNNLQLVANETELIGQQIKWMETDSVDLDNLLKLLIASQQNEEDQSVKNVLDLCVDKIQNLISIQIPEVNKSIKKVLKVVESIELDAQKPKRAVKRSSSSTRNKKNNVVNMDKTTEQDIKLITTPKLEQSALKAQ